MWDFYCFTQNMSLTPIFQIHLDKILEEKAPKLSKKLPRFVVKWFSNLVCQDECNEALRYIGTNTGVDAMTDWVDFFNLKLNLEGTENLPKDGRYIFVSNHPLGGLDGICLSSVLGKYYNKKIKYIVNDILYFIKPLQPIFIPINKHGSQSKKSASLISEAFESDNQILTFPAGLCSRKIKGKIIDTEWKKMFVLKAIEYKRDIVPIYFEGRNSSFFYRLASLRRKLGIKTNIEMLFLPSEMFKLKNARFTVRFGEPVSWQSLHGAKTTQQWADWLKAAVYRMEK